jgi:hypothetical protein
LGLAARLLFCVAGLLFGFLARPLRPGRGDLRFPFGLPARLILQVKPSRLGKAVLAPFNMLDKPLANYVAGRFVVGLEIPDTLFPHFLVGPCVGRKTIVFGKIRVFGNVPD